MLSDGLEEESVRAQLDATFNNARIIVPGKHEKDQLAAAPSSELEYLKINARPEPLGPGMVASFGKQDLQTTGIRQHDVAQDQIEVAGAGRQDAHGFLSRLSNVQVVSTLRQGTRMSMAHCSL